MPKLILTEDDTSRLVIIKTAAVGLVLFASFNLVADYIKFRTESRPGSTITIKVIPFYARPPEAPLRIDLRSELDKWIEWEMKNTY